MDIYFKKITLFRLLKSTLVKPEDIDLESYVIFGIKKSHNSQYLYQIIEEPDNNYILVSILGSKYVADHFTLKDLVAENQMDYYVINRKDQGQIKKFILSNI